MASGGPDDKINNGIEDKANQKEDDQNSNEWQEVNRRKRKRFNTGSAELSKFQALSGDDQLTLFFEKLLNIEGKLPSFDEMKSTVDTVKVKPAAAEKSLSEHDCKITLLNYKSVDLEARSRRNNLIFRSLYTVSVTRRTACWF